MTLTLTDDLRNAIKAVMAQNKWTTNSLAKEMGIKTATLSLILKGQHPRIESFERIANAMGIELNFVVKQRPDTWKKRLGVK